MGGSSGGATIDAGMGGSGGARVDAGMGGGSVGGVTFAQVKTIVQRNCGNCHGEGLAGGESAPPLAGGEFLSTWDGLTLGDLLERIRKTMPVDKPRSLSREVYVDTLAHILATNKFPAGAKDLPQETERLALIKVEQTKK